MMGVQLLFILAASIANFGLTPVQPLNEMAIQTSTSKGIQEGKIRGNFQNLFDSMVLNDTKKSEIYQQILKHEVAKRRQAFDAMKKELQFARYRNAHKKINFYNKNYVGENVVAAKRETNYDYNYDDYEDADARVTTKKPVIIANEHLQLYRAACNKSLEFYRSQKAHVDSVKQKYFDQLTKKGIEIKKFYDLLFRCEDVISEEVKFVTENFNKDASNFTEWTEPLDRLQIVKLLHNWKEVVRCIDDQKGENPPETIVNIRKEALETFDEIAPCFEDVLKLINKLPKFENENKNNGTVNATSPH